MRSDVIDSVRGNVFFLERRNVTDSGRWKEVGVERRDVTDSVKMKARDLRLRTVQGEGVVGRNVKLQKV